MQGAVGGTFNVFHKGHRMLLSHAARLSKFLYVGVTTDEMAAKSRSTVRKYADRAGGVSGFLDSLGKNGEYTIRPIEDVVGFAAEPGLDVLFVSEETRHGADVVNEERAARGLPPLCVHVLGSVLADDGLPLSATRVLGGEVDADGHLFRPVKICVGTSSPAKLEGVRRAAERLFPSVNIVSVKASSGVSEQPMGLQEMLDGAMGRARETAENEGDYGVGLEHGILENGMGIHLCVIMNRLGEKSIGHSPGCPMPPWVVGHAKMGKSVSQSVEEVLGTDNIGRHGGITGLLSNNTLTREELVEYAVLSAFLPWIRSDLYGLSVE